ncbi:cation transport protein-domain-containing protein [Xylaria bambusicola]|uniref:cation transport protein-domain-containing protein n=1 Tax=Xylaria bambusicola TaxID=326684 RepID=UPI0020083D0A|nr:cation transport protein-domain-containing protein [Xylaria bambusicola]KAI0517080.1 cation transport protein-domain-containing protein [Xylaria bambusicola]
MTEAGLNTVNLSQMTTWQQVLLWFLIIIGSSIWVSIWTVLIRKHAFEHRFAEIVKRERQRSHERRNTSLTLLPIAQRFRSLGRSRNASTTFPSVSTSVSASAQPRNHAGTALGPISSPTNGRLLSTIVPPSSIYQGGSEPGIPYAIDSASHRNIELGAAEHRLQVDDDAEGGDRSGRAPSTTSEHVTFADVPPRTATTTSLHHEQGVVQRHPSNINSRAPTLTATTTADEGQYHGAPKIGRNAQFHGLTNEEREKLGGTEYRALRLLSIVVPVYFVSWQFLGSLALGAWIANNQPQPALDNAISPWWNGIFNGVSAFNNSGMSVLDANMIPYGASYFVLIVMGTMILAGNTAYPIFLRLCIWASLKILNLVSYSHDFVEWKATLEYILKYPRRVYTNLFPQRQTWWLVFMLFVLNGTDWVAFEILNFGNSSLSQVQTGPRAIDGLFQALAVRSGGFYVVSIPDLYIGLQVLYVIMMYIAVYPVVITMRHSNVYEERSLGIYGRGYDYEDDSASETLSGGRQGQVLGRLLRRTLSEWHGVGAVPDRHNAERDNMTQSRIDFIGHQIRGQLSHDLWWLVVAVLVIMIIETHHFLEDPVTFSVFNVMFEVVSAYGCVGISIGFPKQSYSFSGGLYPGSKLVLCAVMLRGRHRGLPVALDRAVRLPGDEMHREEEEDHEIRRSMSVRRPSINC